MNFLATLKKTLKENEKDLISASEERADEYSRTRRPSKDETNSFILGAIIILVALISFGLGRLSKIREQKTPITIENGISMANGAPQGGNDQLGQNEASKNLAAVGSISSLKDIGYPSTPSTGGKVVASKSGTKYHYPWCAGASKISDKNKVWFTNEDEAKKAGYTPANNCKGLK